MLHNELYLAVSARKKKLTNYTVRLNGAKSIITTRNRSNIPDVIRDKNIFDKIFSARDNIPRIHIHVILKKTTLSRYIHAMFR